MFEPSTCPHCSGDLYSPSEFCPHCRVRLFYPQRSVRLATAMEASSETSPPKVPRSNAGELEFAANTCARLSGASLTWPVIALALALYRGFGMNSIWALFLGLAPAAVGAGCFFAASVYLRAEKRRAEGSSDLVSGAVFALLGAGTWAYAVRFFMGFSY